MAFRTNKTPVLQEKSASGSVAIFNTALAMPLVECKVGFSTIQTGSGTATPDNKRPFTKINSVTFTANNLVPFTIHLGDYFYDVILDLINDEMTVNRFGFMVNNDTQLFLGGSSGDQIRALTIYVDNSNYPLLTGTALSSDFTSGIPIGTEGRLSYSSTRIYSLLDVDRLETADNAGAKKWLIDNNVEYVYQITPYKISLSNIPTLSTIIGNNSFASDSGSIDLTYKDLDIAKRGNFREVFKLPS